MRHRIVGLVAGLSLLAAAAIGATTVLPAPPAQAAYPGRNGKIAYVITSPDGTSHDIWTVNPDGTGNRRITSNGKSWHPRWSPDGKLIAFERNKDIYIMTPTGSLVRRVTTTGRAHQPTWSPNGRRIAFVNVLANGHGDIFTVAATGGPVTRVTRDAATTCGDDRPTWSPLGGQILYHQRTGSDCSHNRILLVTLSSGAKRVVTEDLNSSDVVIDPDFAADGRHVVIMARCETSDPISCAIHSYNAMVVGLDGLNRQALTSSDGIEGEDRLYEVAAAPDGQHVLVVGHTWPGYYPDDQRTFIYVAPFDPAFSNEVISVDDSVGSITQPDWQPLP
jgi:dipeptidyl aminopeptidase/acylaminoacyl peptidase